MILDAVTQLLDLPQLRVLAVDMTPTHLTITVASEAQMAACPLCQARSWRVHSHYQRMMLDLNWGVRTVTLVLQVRRFVCEVQPVCGRYSQNGFPELLPLYARRTIRLRQELRRSRL